MHEFADKINTQITGCPDIFIDSMLAVINQSLTAE